MTTNIPPFAVKAIFSHFLNGFQEIVLLLDHLERSVVFMFIVPLFEFTMTNDLLLLIVIE